MPKQLLIIGYVWPEPKSSAAGSRMLQLIHTFKKLGYKITFATPCAKSENAFDLNTLAIPAVNIALNCASFDAFVKELNPNVVVFDRFMMEEQFGWRVAENCPNALRILDTEDLHFLRKARQQAFKEKKPFSETYLYPEIAKREIASIYRCDFSLIISETEMELLQKQFNIDISLLHYLPFIEAAITENEIAQLPKIESRKHFITIGNFLHEPNYNALLYLKESIWPLIRKQLPKAQVLNYGAYASAKITQLHNEKEGFLIQGFVENAAVAMQEARVCLAPIRFGAGLKGKLIDAMQNGTPSVQTTIAAEGMYGNLKPNGFIADKAQEFADKAVALYTNETLWQEKQQNGFTVINQRFNKAVHEEKFSSKLQEAIQQMANNRQQNFIGQMLQHHTMQSTKYLSKWIAAKNS
ncbi:MAG: glycosyltransferase family 4 protein [Oceanihabitans sp.]